MLHVFSSQSIYRQAWLPDNEFITELNLAYVKPALLHNM